jgi:hypothetical protein
MCVTQRTWAGNSCVTPYEAAALLRSTREDEMVNAEPNGALGDLVTALKTVPCTAMTPSISRLITAGLNPSLLIAY